MSQGLVIVIDDENDILDLLEYNFLRHGFEVLVFDRALPAYHYILKRTPDIIICDWMMPGMNGLELCEKVKSTISLAEIPFIMVSCIHDPKAINKAYSCGITDYIVKPARITNLVQRVKGHMKEKNHA